jgi:hypothetical protein
MKFRGVFLILALLAVLCLPSGCNGDPGGPGGNTAAIIDQLYLLQPNPELIASAAGLLESAGYEVDLWQGADITVDFYRKLPGMGYRVILLRVHSGTLMEQQGDEWVEVKNTFLFTSENYSTTRYVSDQLADKVSYAEMDENTPVVFAVNSDFFRGLKGSFDNTVILAMGCESYRHDDLPLAFRDKGASAYIGWSDIVSLEHVDKIILDLLENLCTDNMTIGQAVSGTLHDLGNDPYFNSYLKYYPLNSGGLTVEELVHGGE